MHPELGLLQPYWLLLLPLPWLWLYRVPHADWPALLPRQAVRYPPLAHLPTAQTTAPASPARRWSSRLTALALSLMLLALAQPVRYTQPLARQTPTEPVDTILVVGTAVSMSLRDYRLQGQPVDRMSLARTLVDGYVKNYRGRHLGLVILGHPPALWLPLTTDRSVVRDAVSRIRSTLGGRLTDMGATLQLVRQRFAGPGDKVVVMVTDGGVQLGAISPQAAARALPAAGFSLYVIAMGSQAPDTAAGERSGLIYEPTDLESLQQLATLGGGRMFPARDEQSFQAALQAIETEHRRPVPVTRQQRLRKAWYPLPLGLGMLLLVLAALGAQAGTTGGPRPWR